MKDFRKTANWKKFTEEFPIYSDKDAILVCRIDPDSYDIEDDEFTVGYLEYCPYAPYNVGLTIFGYTYFCPESPDQLDTDLVNYVWDYLES